jgi:thiamine-phosphate pyrophosphorylase
VYVSGTKTGLPSPLGLPGLRSVVSAAAVPVIAISGITVERVPGVLSTGAHGVAVIGAVTHAPDPRAATRALLAAVAEVDEEVAS